MPKCKCEHWQICPMCAPHFFDADGKRKPPELTPLQECRAALDALRQAAKITVAACSPSFWRQPERLGDTLVLLRIPNCSPGACVFQEFSR